MYGKCTAQLVAPLGGLRAAYSAKLMIPLLLHKGSAGRGSCVALDMHSLSACFILLCYSRVVVFRFFVFHFFNHEFFGIRS